MGILVSWKNSLNLLKPNNAYLLFLVSLKAAFDGLRLISPFLLGALIARFAHLLYDSFIDFGYVSLETLAEASVRYPFSRSPLYAYIYLFLVAITVHPSVRKKTANSIFSADNLKLYFVFLGITGITEIVLIFIKPDLFYQSLVYSFGILLFIFSFLDAAGSFLNRLMLSLKRTAKVVYYNIPVWIILLIFAYFIRSGIRMFQCFLLNNVSEIAGSLFGIGMYIIGAAVLVAIINTVYIKRVYDEKELYI